MSPEEVAISKWNGNQPKVCYTLVTLSRKSLDRGSGLYRSALGVSGTRNSVTIARDIASRERSVIRCKRAAIAVAFLTISTAGCAQLPERPHSGKPANEPVPSGTATPELETFGRMIALQARPEQVEYFNSAIESTDAALQESRQLQQPKMAANDVGTINAMSLRLRDSLDDVEHYDGRLMASFTKYQEKELKKLTKQMHKSYSFVTRDAKTVQQLMDPGRIVPEKLVTGAANLEKALSDFRADLIRLGREMGIQSR